MALAAVGNQELIRTYLISIQKIVESAARLTQQLLAFARKQTASPKVLDLNDTISGMLRMLQRLIGSRYRNRHGRTNSRLYFRTVFHDQGSREGNRTGVGDGIRHRRAKRGVDRCRELPGSWDDVSDLSAESGKADSADK